MTSGSLWGNGIRVIVSTIWISAEIVMVQIIKKNTSSNTILVIFSALATLEPDTKLEHQPQLYNHITLTKIYLSQKGSQRLSIQQILIYVYTCHALVKWSFFVS